MQPESCLKSVHHAQISIPKGAEPEARAFYRDFLGMREIEKPGPLQGRGGFWLELDGFQVHFGVENGVDRQATKAHLAYLVADLPGWAEKLRSRGIEPKPGIPIPGYERFEFRDPFGNRVEFLESR